MSCYDYKYKTCNDTDLSVMNSLCATTQINRRRCHTLQHIVSEPISRQKLLKVNYHGDNMKSDLSVT